MFKQVLTLVLILSSLLAYTQATTISGSVANEAGEPIIGANVVLQNTFRGDQTGAEGFFAITGVENGNYQMLISYIGYETETKEILIGDDELFLEIKLKKSDYLVNEVTVIATRATAKTPVAFTNISKEVLNANNLGQDMPTLLQFTPNAVTTTDAGNGIGYSGIRIRGSDATRINVTINGIPLNDAESQGVFWVNLPDFASSVDNVQIQRGVGTSTNGGGAFGATINLLTDKLQPKPYANISGSVGSFATSKLTVDLGSGLIKNKFSVNGRVSKINSDGYIDRAASDLFSFYGSANYYGKNNSLRFLAFHGDERTYQSWYGVSKETLATDRTFNEAGTERTPPYEDQVDDYKQTHYQLLYTHELDQLILNVAGHYTKGSGFFEQYKAGEDPNEYNLISGGFVPAGISETDLVRRRWLDNDLFGFTYSATYETTDKKINATIGGGWNKYLGDHFGETIFADSAVDNTALLNAAPRYYESTGEKSDFNIFGKVNYQVNPQFNTYLDLQYRNVNYNFSGIDSDLIPIAADETFNFFNPKVGIVYSYSPNATWFLSYSVGNKEPSRSDIKDAPIDNLPQPETLHDFELGYRFRLKKAVFNANAYYMLYDDQLVLTGQINDVGAAIRTNVADSYRLGLELDGEIKISDLFQWRLNAALSQNKVNDFIEFIDDWDNGGQVQINHGKTDLAFSPNVVLGSEIILNALANEPSVGDHNRLDFSWMMKYVGEQFYDNTSLETAQLSGYFVNDLRISYGFKQRYIKELTFSILVRNLFDVQYESNAWIYRYSSGGQVGQFEGLFPQAGRNFLIGLDLKF